MALFEIIGITGAALVLIFFSLQQIQVLTNKSFSYNLGNLLGSAFLIYYAYVLNSLPFIVLNTIWVIFSLYAIIKFNLPKNGGKS